MIKRLIFDVDNTLIEWKNEYWLTLIKVFDELHIKYNEELITGIINSIDSYEEINEYYSRQKMLEHINKTTRCNFDMNFLNTVLKKFEKCVPNKDTKIINTLEYLSEKYELVILTNWFRDVQENRLKNFGILHFFNYVFAGETFKIKPNKESFFMAMEDRAPEECVMIGDNIIKDVQGAINVGMNSIYINPQLPKEEKENYRIINKIEELTEML